MDDHDPTWQCVCQFNNPMFINACFQCETPRRQGGVRYEHQEMVQGHNLRELLDNNIIGNNVEDCAVCLNAIDPNARVAVLPCGHVFHWRCIQRWAHIRQVNARLCPYCREPYTLNWVRFVVIDLD